MAEPTGARKLPHISEIREAASNVGVRASSFVAELDYVALEQLAALINHGSLRTTVSAVLPLDRAVEALEKIPKEHLVGKLCSRSAEQRKEME